MSLVLVNRSVLKAASVAALGSRVSYISDSNHPNHSGDKKKLILPARNYNVPKDDQSSQAFIAAVTRAHTDYTDFRRGKHGKCSDHLFEELIYSTQPEARLTEEEWNEIEKRIVSRFGGMSACRTAWHIDEKTGRCDMHLLLSAKNLDYPPGMTLWAEFGGAGREHLYAAMDRIDVEITRYLNRTPERRKAKHKSAKRRHREETTKIIGKQAPLAEDLTKYFLSRKKNPTEIDEKDIVAAIESLGHQVVLPVGRTVAVRFLGRKKIRKYNLIDLQEKIVTTLEIQIPQYEFPALGGG